MAECSRCDYVTGATETLVSCTLCRKSVCGACTLCTGARHTCLTCANQYALAAHRHAYTGYRAAAGFEVASCSICETSKPAGEFVYIGPQAKQAVCSTCDQKFAIELHTARKVRRQLIEYALPLPPPL